jgi:metallo-beta-lactamase class B
MWRKTILACLFVLIMAVGLTAYGEEVEETAVAAQSGARLSKAFNRFGNMNPSNEMYMRNYLMAEEPFKIIGNLYFVGNTWCSSHLIDTGKGLMLLDTPALPEFPYLLDSIYRLGFNPKDIKYILVSHAHSDHYGAVKALVHMTGAKTFMGEVDAQVMKKNDEKQGDRRYTQQVRFNEIFEPDVLIKDGDIVELGNTKIRWVLTPGHTDGVMSHFWETQEGGKTYRVGIYGGAGFSSMSESALKNRGLPLSFQQVFTQSIDKVWNEKVDVMLGNHPFHNDTFEKHERVLKGAKDAFIDPTEWQRFLQELKNCYQDFLKLTPEEVTKMYEKSSLLVFRDRPVSFHGWNK